MKNFLNLVLTCGLFLFPMSGIAACYVDSPYGSFCRLFAPDSPWNVVPVSPVLGTASIPTSSYFPAVSSGAYSTGIFYANSFDAKVQVYGLSSSGIWDPDSEMYKSSVTVERFPSTVVPATGNDGHADIVDTFSGVVHSFWKLQKGADGVWRAAQYAWAPLQGSGWGDPAHYFQGARAAGVPTSGGVLRAHEVNDGEPMYYHALAMSLTYNGLAKSYVFPATSTDSNAASTNSGTIEMGSRLMLPSAFDAQALKTPELRKIAQTLKVYGGMVVDRNTGTPFVIYVENGAAFSIHKGGWDGVAANELQQIRAALRPVVSAAKWLKAGTPRKSYGYYNGAPVDGVISYGPEYGRLNLLSMRKVAAPWSTVDSGNSAYRASFDSRSQAARFPASTGGIQQSYTYTNGQINGVKWGQLVAGAKYTLSTTALNSASVRVVLNGCTKNGVAGAIADTGWVGNLQAKSIVAPATGVCSTKVYVNKPSTTAGVSNPISGMFYRAP